MINVQYRVKNYRSQQVFDREILDKLKLEELEFLCRKYYKDIKYNNGDNTREHLQKKQRYKQICEEISNRKHNISASSTFNYIYGKSFDANTGYVYDVENDIVIEHISFNVNESGYVVR